MSNSTNSTMSLSASTRITISLNEKDMIKMILEFLNNRDMCITMMDLERETGVINGAYSDDILFLRQLILDGQWDDALEFIQPLKIIDTFNSRQFHFLIMKHQFLELLCLKCEANSGIENNQLTVDQLVNYLNELRVYCPSEEEHKKLCLLLTSARLQDNTEFRNWNPSNGRLQCFKEILPLISKFLQTEKINTSIASNDRLFQLLIKGLLYESCVEYCQARATTSQESYNLSDSNILLMQTQLSETDASLLSWLHSLPVETFSCPFEEKSLKINMDRFIKPNLEATWADLILTTPMKPKQMFPYNAVPTGRSRNTELMSRSLAPQYDGLSFGLNRSLIFNGSSATNGLIEATKNLNLTNKTNDTNQRLNNQQMSASSLRPLNGIKEEEVSPSQSIQKPTKTNTSPQSSRSKIMSNSNEMNKTKDITKQQQQPQMTPTLENVNMHDSTLFREYKKNKAQIIQQLEEHEKKREEFVKQLKIPLSNNSVPNVSVVSPSKSQSSISPQQSPNHNQQPTQQSQVKSQPHISNNQQSQQSSRSSVSSSKPRPISEATKFDSLEDITRTATFIPLASLEDQQALRTVDIHPSGNYYVVGSNSKYLRVCQYPVLSSIKSNHVCKPSSVLYKKGKHHFGSIYCSAWNFDGDLIATGSNDKTIKLVKFTPDLVEHPDSEIELTLHNGTVRDLMFMQDQQNRLISAGAGDCKLYITDCNTQQPVRMYAGHEGHVYALYTWSSTQTQFVSGSQDKTCRFWDLRSPECIRAVTPNTQDSPVASVAVDPSGQLLACGHEDSTCSLFDIRGSRLVQVFKAHTSDVRSVRFSPNAYYLLTASYDGKCIITDLHGDLTKKLNWSVVAQHQDKVIQARWHPSEMSFVSTSADRTCVVWGLPSMGSHNSSASDVLI